MLNKSKFYDNWKVNKVWSDTRRDYVTPKWAQKHFWLDVGDHYEIVVNWSADYKRQIFGIFSCQLIDKRKQGSHKYVCNDLIIKDIFSAGITSDYKMFKYLDEWITEQVRSYEAKICSNAV